MVFDLDVEARVDSIPDFVLVDSDGAIFECVRIWEKLSEIAVDIEGEFNLHVYGEHLCLIQIFDGLNYYIVDPKCPKVSKEGLLRFFQSKVRKVWFDCQSDQSLIFKKYGFGINNVTDLRVMAQSLGKEGNLVSLEEEFLGIKPEVNKKKHQQAN